MALSLFCLVCYGYIVRLYAYAMETDISKM